LLNSHMKTLKEDMGERIRAIREECGLTLAGLGKRLCLGKTAVHQYEQGISTPSLESLVKIAELGNISLDSLITGKSQEHEPPPAASQPHEWTAPVPPINTEILNDIIAAVEEHLAQKGITQPPTQKKAELIGLLYQMTIEDENKKISHDIIGNLIKLAR